MKPQRIHARDIVCPTCFARPLFECWRENEVDHGNYVTYTAKYHKERIQEAQEKERVRNEAANIYGVKSCGV